MNYSLALETKSIGQLNCRIVDTPKSVSSPEKILILCHGFGAPGDDLVPCSSEIASSAPDEIDGVRFVFPEAPIELDNGFGDSRAWWPIDMEQLQEAMLSGNLRDLRNDEPELLSERRAAMLELIEHLKSDCQLQSSDIFLGGFSQGSMVATDVALDIDEPPGGLIIWSGTLLNEKNWKEKVKGRDETTRFPIFQSHGTIDPILPFVGAEWLRDMLMGAGFKIEFHPFDGQHTIPLYGITGATKLLTENLNK